MNPDDDYCTFDPDAPIPYSLTDAGRAALLDYEVEHHPSNCRHPNMRLNNQRIFECRDCGQLRPLQRSQPTFTPIKRRND